MTPGRRSPTGSRASPLPGASGGRPAVICSGIEVRAVGTGSLLDHFADRHTACIGSCSFGARVSFCRISRHRPAWPEQRDVLAVAGCPWGSSRSISLVTSAIVARGVPSSCAAAAARPSSACSFCSRASTMLGGGAAPPTSAGFLGETPSVERQERHARVDHRAATPSL